MAIFDFLLSKDLKKCLAEVDIFFQKYRKSRKIDVMFGETAWYTIDTTVYQEIRKNKVGISKVLKEGTFTHFDITSYYIYVVAQSYIQGPNYTYRGWPDYIGKSLSELKQYVLDLHIIIGNGTDYNSSLQHLISVEKKLQES
jgi:hypothetical protein